MATERQTLFDGAVPRTERIAGQKDHRRASDSGLSRCSDTDDAGSDGSGGYTVARTASEHEEHEVQRTKDEIRSIKLSDIEATGNALKLATRIEQTGRDTLARLGMQADRLHHAERRLDEANFENERAEDKVKELRRLNQSMFRPVAGNPFTRRSRARKAATNRLAQHQRERETLQTSRTAVYGSESRRREQARDLCDEVRSPQEQRCRTDRLKYQFEGESDDDAMEGELEDNLHVSGSLKARVTLTVDAETHFIGLPKCCGSLGRPRTRS